MEIAENLWKSPETGGNRQESSEINGNHRLPPETGGNYRILPGNRWKSLGIFGNRRKSVEIAGHLRKPEKIVVRKRIGSTLDSLRFLCSLLFPLLPGEVIILYYLSVISSLLSLCLGVLSSKYLSLFPSLSISFSLSVS